MWDEKKIKRRLTQICHKLQIFGMENPLVESLMSCTDYV